jgi:hypothetical protein
MAGRLSLVSVVGPVMGATTEPVNDPEPAAGRRGACELLRQSFLSGVAVVVPLLVTLVVGFVTEIGRTRGRLDASLDTAMASIPGVAEPGWGT